MPGLNKIYSFGVVQYCRPEDIQRFVDTELAACREDREYTIFHGDIPDADKAWNYYSRNMKNLDRSVVQANKSGLRIIFPEDGSCWHELDQIAQAFRKRGVKNCRIVPGFADYRSSVLVTFNGKEVSGLK